MRKKSDQQKDWYLWYQRVKSIEFYTIIIFCIGSFIFELSWDGHEVQYLTIVSIIFSVESGCVAVLHSRLPEEQREKVNWPTRNIFSVHPYVTFLFFLVLSLLCLLKFY